MEQRFEIISYVGALPLRFGMTQDEVEKIFGKPAYRQLTLMGRIHVAYDAFYIRYTPEDQKLADISFSPESRLFFDGIDIFRDPKSFEKIVSKDSCPYESVGFVILIDLGMAMTGFHDGDEEQLAVTVFPRQDRRLFRRGAKKFRIP